MSVVEFREAIEELCIPGLEPEEPEPEPVVKLTKKQIVAQEREERQTQKRRASRTTLRVRDTLDEHGDLMFDLAMCTYDRRAIDDIAERYNLNLIFINEYNDYERDEWQVRPTEEDV